MGKKRQNNVVLSGDLPDIANGFNDLFINNPKNLIKSANLSIPFNLTLREVENWMFLTPVAKEEVLNISRVYRTEEALKLMRFQSFCSKKLLMPS